MKRLNLKGHKNPSLKGDIATLQTSTDKTVLIYANFTSTPTPDMETLTEDHLPLIEGCLHPDHHTKDPPSSTVTLLPAALLTLEDKSLKKSFRLMMIGLIESKKGFLKN